MVLIKSSKVDSSTAVKSLAYLVIAEAVGTDELEQLEKALTADVEVESSESLFSELVSALESSLVALSRLRWDVKSSFILVITSLLSAMDCTFCRTTMV